MDVKRMSFSLKFEVLKLIKLIRTFSVVLFDSFTRFAATGIRAVSANIVPVRNHGMYSLFNVDDIFYISSKENAFAR